MLNKISCEYEDCENFATTIVESSDGKITFYVCHEHKQVGSQRIKIIREAKKNDDSEKHE